MNIASTWPNWIGHPPTKRGDCGFESRRGLPYLTRRLKIVIFVHYPAAVETHTFTNPKHVPRMEANMLFVSFRL